MKHNKTKHNKTMYPCMYGSIEPTLEEGTRKQIMPWLVCSMDRVQALAPKGDVLGLQVQSQAPFREHAGGKQSMCTHIPFSRLQAPRQSSSEFVGIQEEGVPGAWSRRRRLWWALLGHWGWPLGSALKIFGVLWYSKSCPPPSLWFF